MRVNRIVLLYFQLLIIFFVKCTFKQTHYPYGRFQKNQLKYSNPVACCYGYGYALKKETDNIVNSTFDGCIKMFSSDQNFSWLVN